MSTLVEFTTSFGEDNFLYIIAEVFPGQKQITYGPNMQPAFGPTVEVLTCTLVQDEEATDGINFEVSGLGTWNRRSNKYSSLVDAIEDECIERASE
ncbi:hypothetical protein [uncultured Sneathiella sp.]|uniref:hypothetical protein n=1 Tax=uncultured Sneathiella sp. TaxID=879315 RepID=UPI0030EC8F3D|tara:strand:- start:968 stop:1255 length:288 start_codon:yes stop_codon:yes gene_type:complete